MAKTRDFLIPSADLVSRARQLAHELRPGIDQYALLDRETGTSFDLPDEVSQLVRDAFTEIARNQAVCLTSLELELTTNQTADVLNVSRTFVLGLIAKNELPCRLVGTHRRIKLEDALGYRAKMKSEANAGIATIATLDRELGLDD